MLDLEPATRSLGDVVAGLADDQLGAETPCRGCSVGDLVDHVGGLAQAFTAGAAKVPLEAAGGGPSFDAARLAEDWRTRVPAHLAGLAAAWRERAAWEGMTRVAGTDLPGEAAGLLAADEVLVHAWDIAVALGRPPAPDPTLIEPVLGLVRANASEHPKGMPGMFGPPVPVPDGAPPFDRLLGLTGRDPAWGSGRSRG